MWSWPDKIVHEKYLPGTWGAWKLKIRGGTDVIKDKEFFN